MLNLLVLLYSPKSKKYFLIFIVTSMKNIIKTLSHISSFILVVVLISISNPAPAQFKYKLRTSNLILETRLHYGFTISHHLEMQLLNSHFPAFEISILKKTYGKTRWEYMYNYPIIGISLWYSNLGNSPYLGSGTAIYPFIDFPLISKKKTILYFRLGVGLGYISKKFDRLENYKNIAIGSHLNVAVSLMFEAKYRLDEQLLLSGGIGLTHFSNGSIKTPNFGINIPSVNIGIAYRLNKENPYTKNKLLPELYPFEFDGKRSIDIYVSAGAGIKDMQSDFGSRYYVYTAFANVFKRISFKSKLGLGFDLSYDGSDIILLERNDIEIPHFYSIIKPGINVAYELEMSKVSLVFNLGMYLCGMEKSDGSVYEKLAFRYMISDRLFTNITFKAHSGRADFIALGIGYKFNLIYY